jgi:hypothetical protein
VAAVDAFLFFLHHVSSPCSTPIEDSTRTPACLFSVREKN